MTDARAAAEAAITRIQDAERAADLARADRDVAVLRMHVEGGMRPPEIARTLGMSSTSVRLAITLAPTRGGNLTVVGNGVDARSHGRQPDQRADRQEAR